MKINHKFTIAEIILVFIIVGALFAPLVIKAIHDYKARPGAWKAVCTSNQKQIAIAAQMFAQENESVLPTAEKELWAAVISNEKILRCLYAKDKIGYGYNSRLLGKKMSDFKEPELIILTADTTEFDDHLLKSAADFDFRHKNSSCLVSHLDGHVAAIEEDSRRFKEAIAVNFAKANKEGGK